MILDRAEYSFPGLSGGGIRPWRLHLIMGDLGDFRGTMLLHIQKNILSLTQSFPDSTPLLGRFNGQSCFRHDDEFRVAKLSLNKNQRPEFLDCRTVTL